MGSLFQSSKGIYLLVILITLFFSPLIINSANAKVVINEVSPLSSPDWVELYAFEDEDVSGWIIRDSADSPIEVLPEGSVIGPSAQQFLVVDLGNRLNKDGDIIKLLKADDTTLVDQITYGNEGGVCVPLQGQSIGRYPDANPVIERFSSLSKGFSNDDSPLNPCPSPTSVPTNTSTPTLKPTSTSTPVPTNTPTITPKPTPTPTPIPTKTLTPTDTSIEEEENSQILGVEENEEDVGDEGSESESENKKVKFPLASGAFILTGLGLIGFPVISYFRQKKGYNSKND